MRNFLLSILAATVALSVFGYGLFSEIGTIHYTPALPITMLIVATVTCLAHYFLREAIKKKKQREFNNLFLTVTGGKLMLYLFGTVIYVVLHTETAKAFLLSFLVLYFVYTSIEVVAIISHIKRSRAKGN